MLVIYKHPIQNKAEFLQQLSLALAFYCPRYENIIIIRDSSVTVEKSDFMQTFALSYLVTKSTCHQSEIATCFDIILTNKKNLFKVPDNF